MLKRIVLVCLAAFLLAGCDWITEKAAQQSSGTAPQEGKQNPTAAQGYERFVPMAQSAAGTPQLDFALDTKTGQIFCLHSGITVVNRND